MKFVRTIALLLFYLYPLTTAQAQEAKENKADSLKHNNKINCSHGNFNLAPAGREFVSAIPNIIAV